MACIAREPARDSGGPGSLHVRDRLVARAADLEEGVVARHVAGGIELVVDGKKHILGEGDSFRFNSNRPHQFRNAGDRPAKAIWVNYREK